VMRVERNEIERRVVAARQLLKPWGSLRHFKM
jgi:hypothetical protein